MGEGYLDLILIATFVTGVIVAGFWVMVESKVSPPALKPDTPSGRDAEYQDVVERVRRMMPEMDVWGAPFADGEGYGIYAYNGKRTACFHLRSAITVNGHPVILDVTEGPGADDAINNGVKALERALGEIGNE